jgi:hypothetical protein
VLHGHELRGFCPGFFCLRDVEVHFVAVKVGVVGFADALVEAEGAVGTDFYAVREDGESVEGGLTVEEDNVAISDVAVDDVADSKVFCKLDAVGVLDGSDVNWNVGKEGYTF